MKRSHESRTRGRTRGRPFRGGSPDRFRQAIADRMEAGDRMQAGEDINTLNDKNVAQTDSKDTALVAEAEKAPSDDSKPADGSSAINSIEITTDAEESNDKEGPADIYAKASDASDDEEEPEDQTESNTIPIESNIICTPIGYETLINSNEESMLDDGDTNFSDLEGIDMEIIDDDEECLGESYEEASVSGLVVLNEDMCDIDTEETNGNPTEQSSTIEVEDDDLVKIVVDDSPSSDDMLEFMNSLGAKGATGLLELTIAGVPPVQVAAAETAEIRMKRKVVVHNVLPSDLSSTTVQELFRSEKCIKAKLDCERLQLYHDNWHGQLELMFGSANVASNALTQLKLMRDNITVEYGKPSDDSNLSPTERLKMQEAEMKPWIDLILIIKNIGEPSESCRAKLSELFPDAEIVFHKDSPTELLKGKAYLIFDNKESASMAVNNFKLSRPCVDGRRLILLPWSINQILPEGMLKIGERRLAIMALMETEGKLAKCNGDAPYLEDKHKALCDIVARDTKARHTCGFPAPSYNQMKNLQDVRQYTDAEKSLIMRRLLMPYNCGVRNGKVTEASKPLVTDTTQTFPDKALATTKAVVTESGSKSVQVAASTKNGQRAQQVAKQTTSRDAEKKPVILPGGKKPVTSYQSSYPSKSVQSKKPIPVHVMSKPAKQTAVLVDVKNRSTGRTMGFNKRSPTSLKTIPAKKPTPLLDLPIQPRSSGPGLLGTPPPIQTVQKPKPLLSLNTERRSAPGVRSLLPEPFELLAPPPSNSGRQSQMTNQHQAPHESDSMPLLMRPPVSNVRSAGSVARSSLLGSHPSEDEPPPKITRVANRQLDTEEIFWAAPAPRFSGKSQQTKEKYDISLARDRLARTLEEGRSNPSSSLLDRDVEINLSDSARNWVEDRASMHTQLQPRSLHNLEMNPSSGVSNRIGDHGGLHNQIQSRGLLDTDLIRSEPASNWGEDRAATQSQLHGRDERASVNDYQRTMKTYGLSDQMNSRMTSFGRDDHSRRGLSSDRGLYDHESAVSIHNQGRTRERSEWNQSAAFGEADSIASDASYAWNLANARNETVAHSSSLARISPLPIVGSQWSRGEHAEDLRSSGSTVESRRHLSAGVPDVRRRSDSPLQGNSADQSDTVSLLLNLSQLLADKLQRDREKKRNQSREEF